jgi:hypothetical protein
MDRQARIVAGKEQDMTREDILKLARVVGLRSAVLLHIYDGREGALTDQELAELQRLERFFRLAYESGASAEREKVAAWMRSMGYATGHGDTIEDLLDHFGTQLAERLLMEREACAKVCDAAAKKIDDEGEGPTGYISWVYDCATAIRARGNK